MSKRKRRPEPVQAQRQRVQARAKQIRHFADKRVQRAQVRRQR